MPEPGVLSEQEAAEIFALIKKKEESARVIQYRGFTSSRITNERLGSKEFESADWRWPEDFAPHYVRDHRCRPSDAFLEFIGYKG
jgi:hypothetical protein